MTKKHLRGNMICKYLICQFFYISTIINEIICWFRIWSNKPHDSYEIWNSINVPVFKMSTRIPRDAEKWIFFNILNWLKVPPLLFPRMPAWEKGKGWKVCEKGHQKLIKLFNMLDLQAIGKVIEDLCTLEWESFTSSFKKKYLRSCGDSTNVEEKH